MKGEKKDLLAYIREGHEMTQGEKLNLIIQLSIPSILAQISTVLMFFIDAAMVGHLGARQAASIGLVESASWLFAGLTSACSMGFSVQVAHAIGANDLKRARRILRQSLTCCLLFSLFLVVIAASIHRPLPLWLGGSPDIISDASLYFLIFSCAAPFFQMESLFGSMLKCSGNMKIPSVLNILMCCFDVTFNYLFIFILDMGVPGAALGTTVAIFITTLMMGYFLFWRSNMLGLFGKKARDIQNPLYKFKPKGDVVRTAFKIAAPMGMQHMLMNGAQIVSTMIVAPLGTMSIAAHSLGICVMSLMGVLMFIFAPELMTLMTPVEEIIAIGTECLRIEAFAEPMFAAAIVCNGIFVGAGDTLKPAIMSLGSMWGVRLTLAALLAGTYGLPGVWTAMAIELTFRGIIFLVRLWKFEK